MTYFDKIRVMNYLPNKLNKLRKHYNYSQQYVADKLSVDVMDYMSYENGSNMINYSQMKKIASLYHVSVKDIFENNDDVELHNIKGDTDEINSKYFMSNKNGIKAKIKGFVINHKIATIIIGTLLLAIIVLSILLSRLYKPYTMKRENINRLSVSETTVIYIEDSGAIGFSGSNTNGQLNDLAVSNAIKVCEGDGFSAVLNDDGTVKTSGLISKYSKEISDWTNIIDIATGDKHIVAVDSNGRVYCTGESSACDIDGTKNATKVFATANSSIALSKNGSLMYEGTLIGSSSLKDHMNIKDIASSDNILVILNNDSTINVYSKSGSYIKAETWNEIVDVACGDDFVAGLDVYGKVKIEIENDEIEKEVSEWSNIIAIAAGKDFLIGFDGKNIHGVGNNKYNQFVKEEKKKITLEKVTNILYTLDQNCIYIQFDGVNNASGYLVEMNVGTGLSKHIESAETVSFLTENMIEGKTYTISVTSLGEGDYKDSDVETTTFVYNKPEIMTNINVSSFIGKKKEELEDYLKSLDISFAGEVNEECKCETEDEIVTEINGLEDKPYSLTELSTILVKYKYCKVEVENEQQDLEN